MYVIEIRSRRTARKFEWNQYNAWHSGICSLSFDTLHSPGPFRDRQARYVNKGEGRQKTKPNKNTLSHTNEQSTMHFSFHEHYLYYCSMLIHAIICTCRPSSSSRKKTTLSAPGDVLSYIETPCPWICIHVISISMFHIILRRRLCFRCLRQRCFMIHLSFLIVYALILLPTFLRFIWSEAIVYLDDQWSAVAGLSLFQQQLSAGKKRPEIRWTSVWLLALLLCECRFFIFWI